jgi:nicotinamidase-related amidase
LRAAGKHSTPELPDKEAAVKEIWGKQVPETLEEVLALPSAVLAIDIQNDFMSLDGEIARAGHDMSGMQAILPKCAAFIDEARSLGTLIVHVGLVTLSNGRSDSPAMLRAKQMISKTMDFCLEGTWGAEFSPECSPQPGDLVVWKHRSSGFVGTNLDQLLRSNGIETVVIVGEQTPGCIEATYRDASYLDYYNVLVEDCVAAYRADLHEASLKIQRARHDVCTAEQVLSVWRDLSRRTSSGREAVVAS